MKTIRRQFIWITIALFSMYGFVFYVYVPITREAMVEGWEPGTPRNTSQYIPINIPTANIIPENFCDSNSLLVIMVCSAPRNLLARKAIRETWGGTYRLGENVSLYFLLGGTINESLQFVINMESEKYGDIVQERFIDSYNNLTLKSVVMLKLVSSFCKNTTKYLMKIDDDMFVNVKLLTDILLSRKQTTDLLMGKLICNVRPIKDTNSKWYSPQYMYSDSLYPNYLSGTGYVMSVDVAQKLFVCAMETPLFHLEDVYLTGICAKKVHVYPVDHPKFSFHKLSYEPCLISHMITAHHFDHKAMTSMFNVLSDETAMKKCPNSSVNVVQWVTLNIRKSDKDFRYVYCGDATPFRLITVE